MDTEQRRRCSISHVIGPCPCGVGLPYEQHCGRVLEGNPAITAEDLMRSRYTAHVRMDADHLSATWQETNRPDRIDLDDDVAWLGLEVVRCERGQALDADGVVEFIATYQRAGKVVEMREISRFARQSGRWVYVDGIRPV